MEPNTPLSPVERRRFNELRQAITGHLQNMQRDGMEAGKELAEINASRLYRESYRTFEDFCLSEYNLTDRRAYQLIDASRSEPLVRNERQARPLKGLEQGDAKAVVAVAKATGPLTAAKVKSAREMLDEATQGLSGAAKAEKQAELINAAEEAARAPAPPRERDRKASAMGRLAKMERDLAGVRRDLEAEPDVSGWEEPAQQIQAGIDRLRQLVKAAG